MQELSDESKAANIRIKDIEYIFRKVSEYERLGRDSPFVRGFNNVDWRIPIRVRVQTHQLVLSKTCYHTRYDKVHMSLIALSGGDDRSRASGYN